MPGSYTYTDLSDDMSQPIVEVTLRYKPQEDSAEWSEPFRTLAVVDTASSICTAPSEFAEQLGFTQPLQGPRRRIETGAGSVDYWMAEVELTIDGQSKVLRPNVGFGGTRRHMHLGYLKVLQHFKAEFRPYDGTFSLQYVPPKLTE